MNIEFKGPRVLVFDVSTLTDTLDGSGALTPLAWQYVVERDLVEKGGLTVVSEYPPSPSLQDQYRLLRALQDRECMSFVDQLDEHILSHLRQYVVSIEWTSDILVMLLRKPITRS